MPKNNLMTPSSDRQGSHKPKRRPASDVQLRALLALRLSQLSSTLKLIEGIKSKLRARGALPRLPELDVLPTREELSRAHTAVYHRIWNFARARADNDNGNFFILSGRSPKGRR